MRLSAVAAVTGGALRVAGAFFTTAVTPRVQQTSFIVTDLMLVAAICGVYLSRRNRLGWVGLVGFVTAIGGIAVIRSPLPSVFVLDVYITGATVTLIGVNLMGFAMLIRGAFPKLAPILWIASLIIGVVGLLSAAMNWGVRLAGVTFGLGFIAAGISILTGKRGDTH